MRAGAAFSFAGLLFGTTACTATISTPVMSLGPTIKEIRVVQGASVLSAPPIWDQMGMPDQPTVITDSDPIAPPLYQPPVPPIEQAAVQDTSCRRAAVSAERRHRLPHGLLSAIAFTESSMIPTALRVDGRPLYPKSKTEAEMIADQALGQRLSVMAGCMQVNLQVHDPSGASWAFDPTVASNWAAEYLWELYDRLGSWASAISAYGGSRTTNNYLYRVIQNLQMVQNDPSYVQLASYTGNGGGFGTAGCHITSDGTPTLFDGIAPKCPAGGPAAAGSAESADNVPAPAGALPTLVKVTSFRTGCWNLPDWLHGRADACNAASAAPLRANAVASDGGATVRLGGPEPAVRRSPVLRVALLKLPEPPRVVSAPAEPVRRVTLASASTPPAPAGGGKSASGWPYVGLSPNRSPARRKPRFARIRRKRG